jgi:hypothetical protein
MKVDYGLEHRTMKFIERLLSWELNLHDSLVLNSLMYLNYIDIQTDLFVV